MDMKMFVHVIHATLNSCLFWNLVQVPCWVCWIISVYSFD